MTLGIGRLAVAQPGPPPAVDTPSGTGPSIDGNANPAPVTPIPPPRQNEAEPAPSLRPEGVTFAIGIGYTFPDSLEMPNVTSARLRLISGLTFEPRIKLSHQSQDMDTGTKTTDTTTELLVETVVRLPVIRRGRTDFEVLGGAGFSVTKHNGPADYDTNTQNTLELDWGIGIGYWVTPHWQLSVSAENPLVNYTSTNQEIDVSRSNRSSTTTVGVIFDPTVLVMVHLYN